MFRTLLVVACVLAPVSALAQAGGVAGAVEITWEVKNRFRLFRNERDFLRHVANDQGDGVLAAERRLAASTNGLGWARDMANGLCLGASGQLADTCQRDGEKESYLAPRDHRVGVTLSGSVPTDATCAWTFDDEDAPPRQASVPCKEEVRLRVPYGRPTLASVEINAGSSSAQRVTTTILVRDLLIAGLGDSIASGEGNPDRPVKLSDDGFCFRRFLSGVRSEYFRPGRAGYKGDKTCEAAVSGAGLDRDWVRNGAGWISAACHRSLYSYQTRAALALAIEQKHAAVTYLPLACSGATIPNGLFGSQRARECHGTSCARSVPGQLGQLQEALATARRTDPGRTLDLLFLTIGANDVFFSQLVADVIIASGRERIIFERGGSIAGVERASRALVSDLPTNFARLRAALRTLLDGEMHKVVFVSYANPGLHVSGTPCPGGRHGFDVHPAFSVDAERLRDVLTFVSRDFLPRLKVIAQCQGGTLCQDAARDRMTFVDAHQTAFNDHGFCAQSDADPAFDRECFSVEGESFRDNPVEAAQDPLTCGRPASSFRPYASRARWIRTANDSYFTAMTFADGLPQTMQPADIHDPIWGATSVVYGGAIHPTAEGHAAIADAALEGARKVLSVGMRTGSAGSAPQGEKAGTN